jgi:ribosome-associated toxin RatA of RatAB toxin-antitoxin module
MPNIVESIEIERPADAVFELVANIDRMPEWIGTCVAVRVEDAGPVGLGTRFTSTSKFIYNRFDIPFVITEYAPPRALAMRSREGGPFTVENRLELTPTAVGTRLTGTFAGDTTSFYKLAEPVLRRAFRARVRQDLKALKRALEAEVSVTR